MPDPQTSIFLNHAAAEDIRALDGIELSAEALIAGRPYRSWEDVQRAGVSEDGIKALQRQGVEFGEPSSGPIGEPGSGGSGGSPAGNLGKA